jgi:hypothetical protein
MSKDVVSNALAVIVPDISAPVAINFPAAVTSNPPEFKNHLQG